MEKENLLDGYCDYIECYYKSFDDLFNEDNQIEHFYALGLLFVSFMELWIKFCIHNYDGFLENWTVKGLAIDKHDIKALLCDKQTQNEFTSLGIKQQDIEEVINNISNIQSKLKCDNLSFAFRYPCDKNNNFYFCKLSDKSKIGVLNEMQICIFNSYSILSDHIYGVMNSLICRQKVLRQEIKRRETK